MKNLYKYNAVALALVPVLNIYRIVASVSLSDVFCILLILINIVYGHVNIKKPGDEIKLYIAVLIVGLCGALYNQQFSWFSMSSYMHNHYMIVSFGILIILVRRIDYKVFGRALFIVGALASVICILQRFQYVVTGRFYNGFYLPWFETFRDQETYTLDRPSAFFTEPAHLSMYFLPIFYLSIILRKYLLSIILSIGILASGSTTGFIILLVLFIWNSLANKVNLSRILFLALFVISVYGLVMMISPDIISENVRKLANTNWEGPRHLAGFQYASYMDDVQVWAGVGIHQIPLFLDYNNYFAIWPTDYTFGLLYMYLCYGLLGLIALFIYLYRLRKKHHKYMGFFVVLMAILLSDQIIFNMHFVYLVSMVISSEQLIETYMKNKGGISVLENDSIVAYK